MPNPVVMTIKYSTKLVACMARLAVTDADADGKTLLSLVRGFHHGFPCCFYQQMLCRSRMINMFVAFRAYLTRTILEPRCAAKRIDA